MKYKFGFGVLVEAWETPYFKGDRIINKEIKKNG
jgi:hypothetical protein